MAGKQAKILSERHVEDLLFFAETTRHPLRNRVIVLLSFKAGLRAAEIAYLTWDMVRTPSGDIGTSIELRDNAAKMGYGRQISMQADLRNALIDRRSVDGANHTFRKKKVTTQLRRGKETFRALIPLVTKRSSFHQVRISLRDKNGAVLFETPWANSHFAVSKNDKAAALGAISLFTDSSGT